MPTNPSQPTPRQDPVEIPTVTLSPEEKAALQKQLKTIGNSASLEELLDELDQDLRAEGVKL